MPVAQGVTSKAAFKIENTAWGTSTDCDSGSQIHFISESITHAIEQGQAIHLDGAIGAKNLYPIFKKYGGDLLVEEHYAGMESLIATAMGMSHQDLSPVSTSTDAHEHFFEPSEDMSTRAFNGYEMTTPSGNRSARGSLCFEKTISVWELASTMIQSWTMDASPERITFSFTMSGKTLGLDTATNPNSASWALPGNTEQITWEDVTIYLKARDKFTITSSNDNFIIDDGGGDVTLDIADGTYTGYQLAQLIAAAANAHVSVSGVYKAGYDEHLRKFYIYTTDSQTFSITGLSMDMAGTVGMTVDSASGTRTESNVNSVPDAFSAFASGDKVGISKITLAYENTLDMESQDSESDLFILEPERNGLRRITGTIEIPRYKADTWLNATSGYTTYMLWINFAGSAIDSETYEFNIHLPAIHFSNVDAPISGPELITQTLAFEAEVPSIIDFVNHAFNDYLTIQTAAVSGSINAVGIGPDGIYVGETAGVISVWNPDDGTFSTSTDAGAQAWISLKAFQNKMFASDGAGEILKQENGTWSTSTDVGTGVMMMLEEYAGSLYCLERDGGKVFYYPDEDSSWSSSTDTTSTDANALVAYNGKLYMIGSDGSTFTRAYEFDGVAHLTGWSTSCDFGSGSTVQTACIYAGLLYVSSGDVLYSYDGTTWTQVDASIGISPIWMGSWKGNLMMFPGGSNADLYYYNFKGLAAVNINATLNLSLGKFAAVVEGQLFMTQSTSRMRIMKPIKEIMITVQNQNSVNPL